MLATQSTEYPVPIFEVGVTDGRRTFIKVLASHVELEGFLRGLRVGKSLQGEFEFPPAAHHDRRAPGARPAPPRPVRVVAGGAAVTDTLESLRPPCLPASRTERARLRAGDRSFFSSRHLSIAGGAGAGCHPMGTFSYRRQSDLRARRFSAGGSIGDLATVTSYRISAHRPTRHCHGGHAAAASDEGQQSRYRSHKSGELQIPYLDCGVDSGPASRFQAAARVHAAASAELDEKERLS